MTGSQKPGGWGTIRKALCAFSESKSVSFQNKVLISQKPQSHQEGGLWCVSGCVCVRMHAHTHKHNAKHKSHLGLVSVMDFSSIVQFSFVIILLPRYGEESRKVS